MKSWKTTLTGVLTIVAALSAAAISYLQHGTPPDFTVLLPALMSGIGLIHAKDSDGTSGGAALRFTLPVIIATCLIGCAVDPRTGRKLYVGPAFTLSGGYEGASASIHLDPSFVSQKK